MNYQEARRAIEAHVGQNWTLSPVAYDTVDFTDKPDKGLWARCSIFNVTGGQIVLGGTPQKRYRYSGFVLFGIFVPIEDGPTVIAEMNDAGVDLFEDEDLGASNGLTFEDVFAQEQGKDDDGPWFRTDVQANFRFDKIA